MEFHLLENAHFTEAKIKFCDMLPWTMAHEKHENYESRPCIENL